jgi:hypothetical protein
MTAFTQPRQMHIRPITLGFQVTHATFAVATRSAFALEFLDRLYGAVDMGDAGPSLGTYSLLARRGDRVRRWELSMGDSRLAVVPSLGAALNRLEQEICLRTLESSFGASMSGRESAGPTGYDAGSG